MWKCFVEKHPFVHQAIIQFNTMKLFFLLLICVFVNSSGMSCSCIGESSVETEYKKSDLVIIAEVIQVKKIKIWSDTSFAVWKYNPEIDTISLEQYKFDEELYGTHLLEYSVVVEKSFKGAHAKDTLKIRTGFGHGDCGFPFSVGNKYLLFAQDEFKIKYTNKKLGRTKKELKGIYRTTICSRTALLEKSEIDLNYLNKN